MGENTYSISRIDCINNCLHEAYYTYRLGDRGEKNVYTYCGSIVHETLEKIVNGDATEKDLLPALREELGNLEVFGIDFPKDAKGGTAIRDGWIADMEHFCKTYKSPKGKSLQTELEVYFTTPKGNKLVGYIDLLRSVKDGAVEIYDYKTSSMYSKKDQLDHGRQLVIYQLALEQAGYTVKNVNWIFLKYLDVSYRGYKTVKSKEKTEIKKVIERRKLVSELKDSIETELAELGKDELEIELIIEDALENNSIPQVIANLYKIRPCVVTYEVTEDIKQECISYVDNTIEMWERLSDEECSASHREFTKTQKNGKVVSDTYYCGVLCPHKDKCTFYQDFKAQWDSTTNENDEDLF